MYLGLNPKSILRLLNALGMVAALGCSSHHPNGNSSDVSSSARPQPEGDGKPSDDGEELPGYLVDPATNISVSVASGAGPQVTATISGRPGAVAAEAGPPAGVAVLFWRLQGGDNPSPLSPKNGALQATSIGSATANGDGSFQATVSLAVTDYLLVTTVGQPQAGTIPVTADAPGSVTVAYQDMSLQGAKLVPLASTGHLYSYGSGYVSGYSIDEKTGALSLTSRTSTGRSGFAQTLSGALDATGSFFYLADNTNKEIDVFSVDGLSGKVTLQSNNALPGSPLDMLLVHRGPGVDTLFATVAPDSGGSAVATFAVTNGKLTQLPTASAGGGATNMVASPNGQLLFVVDTTGNSVSAFTIAGNGQLGGVTTTPTGNMPCDMAVDPAGRFLYVHNCGDETVSEYSIQTSATLTLVQTVPHAPSITGSILAVDPSGKFLLVPDGASSLYSYSIDDEGHLVQIGSAATGTGPTKVILSPSGGAPGVAYVAAYEGSVVYSVKYSATGLSLVGSTNAGSVYPTAVGMTQFSWDPNGRFLYGVGEDDPKTPPPFAVFQAQSDGNLVAVPSTATPDADSGITVGPGASTP